MFSDKTLYILAVGVLAAGVTQRYADCGKEWAQCALDRIEHMADRTSSKVASARTDAPAFVAQGDLIEAQVDTALARAQSQIDRAQARIECRNAELARVSAQMAKLNSRMSQVRAQRVWK